LSFAYQMRNAVALVRERASGPLIDPEI
jgi:hypothetical protein